MWRIVALCWVFTAPALTGILIVAVLMTPPLSAEAALWIPSPLCSASPTAFPARHASRSFWKDRRPTTRLCAGAGAFPCEAEANGAARPGAGVRAVILRRVKISPFEAPIDPRAALETQGGWPCGALPPSSGVHRSGSRGRFGSGGADGAVVAERSGQMDRYRGDHRIRPRHSDQLDRRADERRPLGLTQSRGAGARLAVAARYIWRAA